MTTIITTSGTSTAISRGVRSSSVRVLLVATGPKITRWNIHSM